MAEKHGYIKTIRPQDVIEDLPVMKPFSLPEDGVDIFICAGGFEECSYHKVNSVVNESPSIAILGKYAINENDNQTYLDKIVKELSSKKISIKFTNPYEPSETRLVIQKSIESLVQIKDRVINIVFDVSGACGTFIMSVLHSLYDNKLKIKLSILYTTAKQYSPTGEEFDLNRETLIEQANTYGDSQTFLEHGIESPSVNELFSGILHEARNNLLIVIPGFRNNRLIRCIQEYGGDQAISSPNKSIYWLFSQPNSTSNDWMASFQKECIQAMFKNCLEQSPLQDRIIFEQCRNIDMQNYTEALKEIITIADNDLHFGKNIHLINMGTKMQTLGCALALLTRPEIGSIFAAPSAFNAEKYSKGIGESYTITFDNFHETIKALKKIGEKEFIPKKTGKDIGFFEHEST